MTCFTRGSRERASVSTLPSSATLVVLSSVEIGSTPGYRERVPAILREGRRVFAPVAALEMARTVRAASSSEALEMSSE